MLEWKVNLNVVCCSSLFVSNWLVVYDALIPNFFCLKSEVQWQGIHMQLNHMHRVEEAIFYYSFAKQYC